MDFKHLVFRVHAIQRMFQRRISFEDVVNILQSGVVLEEYREDRPHPSRLILGWRGPRPLHLVVAEDNVAGEMIIVTVYEPDPGEWEPDFKTRKKK